MSVVMRVTYKDGELGLEEPNPNLLRVLRKHKLLSDPEDTKTSSASIIDKNSNTTIKDKIKEKVEFARKRNSSEEDTRKPNITIIARKRSKNNDDSDDSLTAEEKLLKCLKNHSISENSGISNTSPKHTVKKKKKIKTAETPTTMSGSKLNNPTENGVRLLFDVSANTPVVMQIVFMQSTENACYLRLSDGKYISPICCILKEDLKSPLHPCGLIKITVTRYETAATNFLDDPTDMDYLLTDSEISILVILGYNVLATSAELLGNVLTSWTYKDAIKHVMPIMKKYDPDFRFIDKNHKIAQIESAKLREQGNSFFGSKEYENALIYYDMAKGNDRFDARLWSNSCQAHFQLGEYEETRKEATIAIKMNPFNHKPYYWLANACIKLSHYGEAITAGNIGQKFCGATKDLTLLTTKASTLQAEEKKSKIQDNEGRSNKNKKSQSVKAMNGHQNEDAENIDPNKGRAEEDSEKTKKSTKEKSTKKETKTLADKNRREEEEKKNEERLNQEAKIQNLSTGSKNVYHDTLKDARKYYEMKNFQNALDKFSQVLSYSCPDGDKTAKNGYSGCQEILELQFIIGACRIQANSANVFDGMDTMRHFYSSNYGFSAVAHYFLGVAYQHMALHKMAQAEAYYCSSLIKQTQKSLRWPGSGDVFPESSPEQLKIINDVLRERNKVSPTEAVCISIWETIPLEESLLKRIHTFQLFADKMAYMEVIVKHSIKPEHRTFLELFSRGEHNEPYNVKVSYSKGQLIGSSLSLKSTVKAKCRFKNCIATQGTTYAKEEIYETDPDFRGFVDVVCEENCTISYHPGCWKAYKEIVEDQYGKMSDKDFMGTECVTPDCTGIITRIFIHDAKCSLKVTVEANKKDKKEAPTPIKQKKKKEKRKAQPAPKPSVENKKKSKNEPSTEDYVVIEDTAIPEPESSAKNNHRTQNEKDKISPSPVSMLPINPESLDNVVVLKPSTAAEDQETTASKSSKKKKKKNKKVKEVIQHDLIGDLLENETTAQNEYVSRLRMLKQQREAQEVDAQNLPRTANPGQPRVKSTVNISQWLDPDNPFYLPQHLRDNPEELERILQTKMISSSSPNLSNSTITTLLEFVYQWLKSEGPMSINDDRLRQYVAEYFPPEALDHVNQCGGIKKFLMQSIDFAMIDEVICVRDHVVRAQEVTRRTVSERMMSSRFLITDGRKAKKFSHLLDNKSSCSSSSSASQLHGSAISSHTSRTPSDSNVPAVRASSSEPVAPIKTLINAASPNIKVKPQTNTESPNLKSKPSSNFESQNMKVQLASNLEPMKVKPKALSNEPLNTKPKTPVNEPISVKQKAPPNETVIVKPIVSNESMGGLDNFSMDLPPKSPFDRPKPVTSNGLSGLDDFEIPGQSSTNRRLCYDEVEEEGTDSDTDDKAPWLTVIGGRAENLDSIDALTAQMKKGKEMERSHAKHSGVTPCGDEVYRSDEDEEDLESEDEDLEEEEYYEDAQAEENRIHIESLKEEIETLSQGMKRMNEQNQKLNDKLIQVKSSTNIEISSLKQKMEELKAEKRELESEKNSLSGARESEARKFKAEMSRMQEEVRSFQNRHSSLEHKFERAQDRLNEVEGKLIEEQEVSAQLREEVKNLQESLTSSSRRAHEAEVKYLCIKKDLSENHLNRTIDRLTIEVTRMKQLLKYASDDSIPDRPTLSRSIISWDENIKGLRDRKNLFMEEGKRLLGLVNQGRPLNALPPGDLDIPVIPDINVAPLLIIVPNAKRQPMTSAPSSGMELNQENRFRHPPPAPHPQSNTPTLPSREPQMAPNSMNGGPPGFEFQKPNPQMQVPPPVAAPQLSAAATTPPFNGGAIPKGTGTAYQTSTGACTISASDGSAAAQKYPDSHKLFIGKIPWDFNENDLKRLFSERIGEVVGATVYDKGFTPDGKQIPKYGFVTFRHVEDQEKALAYGPIKVGNHELNVQPKEAKKPAKPMNLAVGGPTSTANEPHSKNSISAYGLSNISLEASLRADRSEMEQGMSTPPVMPPNATSSAKPKFQNLTSSTTVGAIGTLPPKLVRPQPRQPQNVKGGNQTPTPSAAAAAAAAASKEDSGPYKRLIEMCKQRIGREFSSPDICSALREVRMKNSNSLSGLSIDTIVDNVKQRLKARRPGSGQASVAPWAGLTQGETSKSASGPDWQGPASTELAPEEQCSICLDALNASPTVQLQCQHVFHEKCIGGWLKRQSNCPNCRTFALMADEYPSLKH